MLPTPSTSHVDYGRVYEPAEDSFLFLDTLSSPAEAEFLSSRFAGSGDGACCGRVPLVLEVGTGSGVVVAFATAHARHIFGSAQAAVLTLGVDVNGFACAATAETVRRAVAEEREGSGGPGGRGGRGGGGGGGGCAIAASTGLYLGSVQSDLLSALRPGQVDVLLFNPPYVPTPDMPSREFAEAGAGAGAGAGEAGERDGDDTFSRDSYLLELSYAGGRDGMETTDRLIAALPGMLSERGVAYVLMCAQNRPEEVKRKIVEEGLLGAGRWRAETVGDSGKKAGWERLVIVRIWRDGT